MNKDFIEKLVEQKISKVNEDLENAEICPVCGNSFRPAFEGQVCCDVECAEAYKNGVTIWNSANARNEFMDIWHRLIELIGENPESTNLKETPKRILKMWLEVFEGCTMTNDEIADYCNKCFENDDNEWFDGMVVERDIDIFSHCSHHFTLMYDCKVSIGYIPKGKVIGLSKMARVAEMVSKRPQLQENIGNDIRYVMTKILGTDDVIVVIEGKHGCMTARGIKKPNSSTVTASLGGVFQTEPSARAEFYSALKVGR